MATGSLDISERGSVMPQSQPPLKTLALAIGGMSCSNCEVLVERRFRALPGIKCVKVNHVRGYAEVEHAGELDVSTLQRAVADDGYVVSLWDGRAPAPPRAAARDYVQIAGIFAVLIGILFGLQYFDLLPRGLAVSNSMSYGLVFLIGLVASVSSCMAVTGGLLVAAAATYNASNPALSGAERLKPHLYFNAGRIISYTLFGPATGALGSALTLSATANGILTIAASAIMILLGFQMLGILPRFGGSLVPASVARSIRDLASRKVA